MRSVDVFDDRAARLFVPDAIGVDHRAGADGIEDVFGVGSDALGVLGNVGAGDAHVFHAAPVEAGGAGVAVNGATIREGVFGGDFGTGPPVQEIVFDFEAVVMVADGAPASVAGLFWLGLAWAGLFGTGGCGRDDLQFGGLAGRGEIGKFGDCYWCELCAHVCFYF